MPIVFKEDKEVTVSPETGGLEVPGPIPSSMQNEAQALFNEASAEIQKDFPDIKFGKPEKVPKKFTVGGPVAVEGVPTKFTIGGKPALPEPPAPPEPPKTGSSWAILGEHLAGGFERLVKKTPESFKLRNIEQPQDTSIDRALSKYLGDKSPEFLAVRRKALKYTPEERKAVVEKQQQILKGIDDEISKGQIQPDGKWQEWVASAGDSLGFMAPTLALGLLTGPAGALAAIGTATYAESYANHRANGATPEHAQGLAAIDGWTEALTELFPVMRLFKTKGLIKKFVAEVIADIPGEWVANSVQSATEAISKLGKNPTKEQVAEAIQTSLKETTPVSAKGVESMADTAAVTVLAGGALAGAATGIEQGKALLTREPPAAPPPGGTPPPAPAPPSGAPQGTPTPQLQTPPPPPGPPPGGPGGGPPAAPAAGTLAIFKPEPNQPGAAVLIQGIDPQSGQARLIRLDQDGEPVTLPDGEPAVFVAPVDQLILSQQPPAAPQPSQVPPSQTTTEPTLDIAGQIKDMHNGASARRGVYLSPDTIQKMQQEGTYQQAVASGVVAENFDGQGGTLIVRSKKDLQEAMAARDQGQTDMQAIIGSLTGAGVAKPNVPNPAVVQRRDETGAVVQQTMVPQEQAPAAAAVVNQQPGNVSVTSPDAAIAERAAKVEAETSGKVDPVALLAAIDKGGIPLNPAILRQAVESFGLEAKSSDAPEVLVERLRAAVTRQQSEAARPPPNRLSAIVPPPAPVAPVETGPKVGPVTQAQQAVDIAIATLRRPKSPASRIPDIRAAAQDLIAAAMVLRAAVAHAADRGAPDSVIVQANQAAERAEFLDTKTEADYKKSKGVSAKIVAERLLAVQDAVAALKPFENAPKQAPAPRKETKAEKVKKISKKKEAKAEPESKAPADELVTKVLEPPEMREDVRRISDELRARLEAAPEGQVEPLKVPDELVKERTPGEQENEPVQVPKEFRAPGKFIFHQVRNTRDIPSIIENGLRTGSNVSLIDGQAVSELDGGVVLIFENDGSAAPKGYQSDFLTTKPLKPIAILVDTTYAEKPAVVKDEALDALEAEIEQLEMDKRAFRENKEISTERLDEILADYPKGQAYQEMKRKLEGQPGWMDKLRSIAKREDEMTDKMIASGDIETTPAVTTMDVLAKHTKYGLPVYSQTGLSILPTSNVSNKFDEKLARKESAEESALIQDSWKREANARIKKVKSLLEKLDGFKTQPSVNVNMIEGRQAQLDKFLGQMDATFEEGDVGRFNAAAQNAEVIAKEMVALMQEQPAPDNVVSAVGITVVPPGPTRKKKRTKYVPPAKAEGPKAATAEDIEKLAKVAEKALPSKPKPKVVKLAPANVVGTEGEFINDLLGTTDAEITAEIANDTTGRLAAVLQEIVNAIGNRGDWTGWFAASVRGDVIGDKKNALMGAIRKYAAADTRDLNEAREEILGIATNLKYEGTEGWSLPLEAIGAIMEAANISRAYTMMRQEMYDAGSAEANTTYDPETNELIDNRPIRELAEDVTTESQFDTTMLGTPATKDTNATQGTMSNVAENTIQTSIRRKGRKYEKPGPVPKSLINRLWGSVFNYYGTSAMFAIWHDNITEDKALIRKIGEAHFNKSYLSSKEFLKDLMRHLPEPSTALNNKERVFRQFLTSLYEAMPDVPVEFIRWDGRPVDWYGRRRSGFASGMFFGDSANIQVMLPRRGLDVESVETIVHEMIHSATLYELIRNPNGPMNQTLERLRLEIVERAKAKYGRSFTEAYNSMLQDRDNMSRHTKHWKNYIYGLTDTAELSAEILNPYFQEFLASLDQTPTRSWFRGLINKFIRAFNKYVRHSSDPRANQLLNEIMAATYRTMRAQSGRAARLVKARDLITQNLAEMLNIPMERAVAITTLFSTNLSPYQIGGLQKIDPEIYQDGRTLTQNIIGYEWDKVRGANTYGDEQRGYDLKYDDQLLLRAYGLPVEVLGRDLIKNRQIYGPIMKAVDAERTSRAGPPRLKDHEKLRILTGPRTVSSLGMVRRMMGSGVIGELREKARGFNSTDFLIRRGARFFGTTMDALNPLIAWKQIRDSRRMYANQLMELAEKTVNSLWTKLTSAESAQLGDMLQQTTTWQIDPEGGPNQTKLIRTMSNKNWNRKRLEIEAKWNALSENQKDIYRSVQKYFQTEYAKIRRAAVDLAVDSYAQGLSQAQRTALYTVKKVEDIEKVVGPNRIIDLGDGNTQFAKVMKSLVKTTTIKGPYFPLMRKGSWVVEANREGILTDPYTDEPQVFDNEEDAKAAADDIKSRAPKNKAKARNDGNGWIVEYKAHFISFNSSKNEALDEIARLKSEGFQVSVATRKLEEVRSENLSQGLTELMARARQVAQGSSRTEGTEELLVTLETAFTQILAEKAASAQQQLKRQGFEGFKGKEAHETFTRRTRSSSWHYANLKTALASAKSLSEIRKFSKNPELGQTAVRDLQVIADQRGRTMIEIIRRLRVEAAESADIGDHNLDALMGQAGFLNFLASPSYSFINTMQNMNVAMPVIYAEYGPRGARSFLSAMKLVGGPAFAKAMRGMFNKPGQVTSYDVYTAIVEAVKDHPRFGRFTRPGPNGEPSPLQQLVDRNVINASYVQELAAVANNQNLQVTKGLEYIRLFPQGAELFNRISTALAVLEMENGKVDPAADMIDRVHFNYSLENRPRFFRQLGKVRLPQALTMFKMYGVGMYQLGASLVVDAAAGGRRGLTRQQRFNSAKALAGIIAAHTLSAGIIGGLMIEPLRLLREVWNALRGDDDEFGDLDTMIHNWAADVIENETARRMLTNGIWTGLGFDLSSRMGLDRMVLFNPLDFTSAAAFKSSAFSAIAGPMQTVFIDNMFRASDLIDRGQYMKALGTIIPLKVLHDAMKAYELVNKGLTTKDGKEVMPAEKFGYLDMVGRAAGFRTVEESEDTAKSSTRYSYRNWKTARSKELVREYLLAYNEGDAAALAKATTAIEKFNDKNPLDPITYKSITGAALGQEWAALERQGISRRPAETELTDW